MTNCVSTLTAEPDDCVQPNLETAREPDTPETELQAAAHATALALEKIGTPDSTNVRAAIRDAFARILSRRGNHAAMARFAREDHRIVFPTDLEIGLAIAQALDTGTAANAAIIKTIFGCAMYGGVTQEPSYAIIYSGGSRPNCISGALASM